MIVHCPDPTTDPSNKSNVVLDPVLTIDISYGPISAKPNVVPESDPTIFQNPNPSKNQINKLNVVPDSFPAIDLSCNQSLVPASLSSNVIKCIKIFDFWYVSTVFNTQTPLSSFSASPSLFSFDSIANEVKNTVNSISAYQIKQHNIIVFLVIGRCFGLLLYRFGLLFYKHK